MYRGIGVLLTAGGGVLVLLSLACPRVSTLGDQGDPGGVTPAKVAQKCRAMDFTGTKPSAVLDLKGDGTVRIKIVPARKAIHTKLRQLGSRYGRVIAIAVNTGTAPWPLMDVAPNDTSCWHVWVDGDDVLRAQWVSIKGTTPGQPDDAFEIKFHPDKHVVDSAEWNPREVSMAPDPVSVFHLASMEPAQFLRTGNTGWTTCLINGCCRSRQ